MAKTLSTPKGTLLPLVNLKGKDYLMVAHRLQWFNEVEKNFDISSEFKLIDDTQTVCKTTVTIFGENGQIIRRASATKRETKSDFPDHTEKAETGSLGRALLMLGYGTQFALSDLDEGARIVDSPMVDVKRSEAAKPAEPKVVVTTALPEIKKPAGGFGVKKETPKVTTDAGGWE